MNPSQPPELRDLAKQCSTLLQEHEQLIQKFRALMLTQRLTREQAESINPFQWASEVLTNWAIRELDNG